MQAFDTRVHYGARSLQSLTLEYVILDESGVANFSKSFPNLTNVSLTNVCFKVEQEENATESRVEDEQRDGIERLSAILARNFAKLPLTQIAIKVQHRDIFRKTTNRSTLLLIRLSSEYLLQQILQHDALCRNILLDVSLKISSTWKVNYEKVREDPAYKRYLESKDSNEGTPCLVDFECLERLSRDQLVFQDVREDIVAACRKRNVRAYIIEIEEAIVPEVGKFSRLSMLRALCVNLQSNNTASQLPSPSNYRPGVGEGGEGFMNSNL